MTRRSRIAGAFRLSITILLVLIAAVAGAEQFEYSQSLSNDDEQLSGGEYYDEYIHTVESGERIVAEVYSADFDPYLILRSPTGREWYNDDWEGRADLSRIEVEADKPGDWLVVVTSYRPGESGDYRMAVGSGRELPAPGSTVEGPAPGPAHDYDPASPSSSGPRVIVHEVGRLEPGDSRLDSGEFYDLHEFTAGAGAQITAELHSTEFDPYIILRSPSGEQWDNDDWEDRRDMSRVDVTADQEGLWRVQVTTYQPKETGEYQVLVTLTGAGGNEATRTETSGRLSPDDDTLGSGEYYDTHDLEFPPGQRVRIDLSSQEFDTYLIVKPPSGEQLENDDVEGMTGHSILEFDVTEGGTYLVAVTSYSPGATGSYELTVETSGAAGAAFSRQRRPVPLSLGQRVDGSLDASDAQASRGAYQDIYVIDAPGAGPVRVEMSSPVVDTYLTVETPSGEEISNDDFEGDLTRSVVELDLRESGRYTVTATSYGSGQTGNYVLSLSDGSRPSTDDRRPATDSRVRGVFVGISDYPGAENDLAYTADDAVRARDAFVRGAGMLPQESVVLTDSAATADNVRRAIVEALHRMGEDDIFIFFYSGHGSRVPRSSAQPSDPDGIDETIVLHDEQITDDEFARIMDEMSRGTAIVVLDACFSGGFTKDVITRPGRMGLFSSHEDVTSAVAAKFRAGGYLARFLADAVGDRLADDGDRQLTALELSQYIYERYREDVKGSTDDVVFTSQNLGYQQLIVDRGSIRPSTVLFSW
jgi:hypothetical protein